MSPVSEIRFVVERELRRNLRSAKGVVLLLLSILGGASISLLLAKGLEFKREKFGEVTPEQFRQIREEGLSKLYGDTAMGHALADAPEVLLAVVALTVWLTPMLVALMGFDSIAPDIQHRSVRYWTLRTRRWSYFVGKWAGLWLTVSMVTLLMDAMIWILCITRGEATAAATLGWGLKFWAVSLPMSAVWCGIATLVSSLFRAPILALLSTFAAFFVLFVAWWIGTASSSAEFLQYVYPNNYDRFLLHPHADRLLTGLGACAAMAAAYIGLGSFLFTKRDV